MLSPRGEFIGKWAIVKSSQRRPRCSCFGIGQRRVGHNELYIDLGHIQTLLGRAQGGARLARRYAYFLEVIFYWSKAAALRGSG